MTAVKYTVPGIPAGAQLSAFMPYATRMCGSGAQQYKNAVEGQPGTQAIPAPTANNVPGGLVGQAMMGTARSTDAPDMWYPQEYYQCYLTEQPGAGMPIAVYSDNLMPVPAKDPRGTGALLARRIRQSSRVQIGQPRVIPSWGRGG
jgi:hypothetical protein